MKIIERFTKHNSKMEKLKENYTLEDTLELMREDLEFANRIRSKAINILNLLNPQNPPDEIPASSMPEGMFNQAREYNRLTHTTLYGISECLDVITTSITHTMLTDK